MKKWNMIIDVAECTNCNLCTLATMDEYVGNDWPGYTKPMPQARPQVDQHPAEGARADPDDRHRLRSDHVQPLRRRALHAKSRRRDQEARRRHRADRSGEGEGPQGPGRRLSLWPHLVERGAPGAAALDVRRPPDRSGLAADARPAVVPDRRHARDRGRGRRDGAHGARGRPRGDAARARHQAARLLSQPLALFELLHRRLASRRRPTAWSTASRARACGSCRTASWSPRRRATTTATSNSTSSTRTPAPTWSRSPTGRQEEDRRSEARREHQSRRDQACSSRVMAEACPAHPRRACSPRDADARHRARA